jgi:7-keto-8-aminopelargonate synthetase-like enzyme
MQQTSIPSVGFKQVIPAMKELQNYALDHTIAAIGNPKSMSYLLCTQTAVTVIVDNNFLTMAYHRHLMIKKMKAINKYCHTQGTEETGI